jgi:two-component system, NarL family, response regulator NreC
LATTRSDSPYPSGATTLIVADDHDLLRESTCSYLKREPDLRVIGEAKDGQEAIELCRLHQPDFVVMDVSMPRINGMEATKLIKEEFPAIKVLIWSGYVSPDVISEARRVGADGYFLKDSSLEELVVAVRAMHQGEP